MLPVPDANSAKVVYEVDLTQPDDDLFHVKIRVDNLSPNNGIYNFAAIVPGTYHTSDFGRFVQTIEAYAVDGTKIAIRRLSTNRWEIADAVNLAELRYTIEDSYDSHADGPLISAMGGTGIDENVIVLNTVGVLGYFEGLQSAPVKFKVDYPDKWTVGTALKPGRDGYFHAESYDRLADSPVLIGELTFAAATVMGIDVEVYVYSEKENIDATGILTVAEDVLQAAGQYIGFAPVPNYAFLFRFVSQDEHQAYGFKGSGALEHSYSSLYTPRDWTSSPLIDARAVMTHEFMHILTPLHLSSDRIQHFDFTAPNPSEHIWLYEGVTEWIGNRVLYESGLIDMDVYMSIMMDNIINSGEFEKGYSLSQASLESYTERGSEAYINFYLLGAMTAEMLNIRLLDLSGGSRGLREVFLDLTKAYGKDHPFKDEEFFDILVRETYPEIRQFVDDHIRSTKPLQYEDYYSMVGIGYYPERPEDNPRPFLGFAMEVNDAGEFTIVKTYQQAQRDGLNVGDILLKVNGEDISVEVGQCLLDRPTGFNVSYLVLRDGQTLTVESQIYQSLQFHTFEIAEQLTPEQKILASRWGGSIVSKTEEHGDDIDEKSPHEGGDVPDMSDISELGIDLILVPGGTFEMGDTFGDDSDERIDRFAHRRTVTLETFYIGATEVTFAQYDVFCDMTGRVKPDDAGWGRDNRPVINVNWDDAQEFCEWLSTQSGDTYRLPTGAEWEYAARERGRKVRFGNGKDVADPNEINFNGSPDEKTVNSIVGVYRAQTVPVASFDPNALGLYDMAGNVWEWCQDWYAVEYYGTFAATYNPRGANIGEYRVMRGRSWSNSMLSGVYLGRYTPEGSDNRIGFRVARTK
jgi:predicted metalloprotease with PDZ domain